MTGARTGDVSTSGYMPSLDGLRALAAVAVVFSHFMPRWHPAQLIASWGRLGVVLFFVLSAFLITRLLLDTPSVKALPAFYARRALRIFPIYYLTLGALWVLSYEPAVRMIGWHLTYTSNVRFALQESLGALNPVWSLCVEEQFYLLWPFVVVTLRGRARLLAAVGCIFVGVAFRAAMTLAGHDIVFARGLLPGCLDSLGFGALLAILQRESPVNAERIAAVCLGLGVPALVALMAERGIFGLPDSYAVTCDLFASAVFVSVVHFASKGIRPLNWGPLRYLGRISYGLYLYHCLLIPLGIYALGTRAPDYGWAMFFAYGALAIGWASLSWHLVEAPILRLKRRFQYADEEAAGVPSGSPA